jgi:hypothetical protein
MFPMNKKQLVSYHYLAELPNGKYLVHSKDFTGVKESQVSCLGDATKFSFGTEARGLADERNGIVKKMEITLETV